MNMYLIDEANIGEHSHTGAQVLIETWPATCAKFGNLWQPPGPDGWNHIGILSLTRLCSYRNGVWNISQLFSLHAHFDIPIYCRIKTYDTASVRKREVEIMIFEFRHSFSSNVSMTIEIYLAQFWVTRLAPWEASIDSLWSLIKTEFKSECL